MAYQPFEVQFWEPIMDFLLHKGKKKYDLGDSLAGVLYVFEHNLVEG